MMVGINNAFALATAYAGTAIGIGVKVIIEVARGTLTRNNSRNLVQVICVSERTFSKIKQNLVWALGYNTVLAALASLGSLQPVLASSAMAFSGVSVLKNSPLCRYYTLDLGYNLRGFLR